MDQRLVGSICLLRNSHVFIRTRDVRMSNLLVVSHLMFGLIGNWRVRETESGSNES